MKISVVIPTHHRRESLLRLLESLVHQTLDKADFEVLVIFNLPDAELKEEIRRRYGRAINCTVLVTGKLGVNHARHMGGNYAVGKILVYLDDDCRLHDRTYLQRVLDLHHQHPEASAIGGPYSLPAGTSLVERVYHQIALNWLESSVFDHPWTRNLIGGNVSYKRAIFDRGFNFNSRIRFGGAETDFHMRLQQQKLRLLYCPTLEVEHWLEMSRFQFLRKGFLQGKGYETRVLKGIQIQAPSRPNPLLAPERTPAERKLMRLYDYAFQKGRLWARSHRSARSTQRGLWAFATQSVHQDVRQMTELFQQHSFLPGPEAK